MIPEKLHELIPLYVMGELAPGEAAALEATMVRWPELRAEVRACAEALAAVAAESAAPPVGAEAMWSVIERRVRSVDTPFPAATWTRGERRAPVAGAVVRVNWRAWAWPVAAAGLLLVNLAQFWWPRGRAPGDEPAVVENGRPRGGERGNTGAGTGTDAAPPSTADGAAGAVAGAERAASLPSASELAEAHRALVQRHEKLEREYAALSESVVPLLRAVIAEQRVQGTDGSPLWAMEMRGENGEPSQATAGLWDRVRQLVPQNGVSVMPDRWRLAGGVVLDPAWWTGGGNANAGGGNAREPDNAPPPYALAAFNGSDGLGYLDLYNLPEVAPGQELRLWMQTEGQTDYTAVGNVPRSLVGGSGGLAFHVSPSTAPPNRFLITIEPVNQSPQPSGRIVIDGP